MKFLTSQELASITRAALVQGQSPIEVYLNFRKHIEHRIATMNPMNVSEAVEWIDMARKMIFYMGLFTTNELIIERMGLLVESLQGHYEWWTDEPILSTTE